MSSYKSVRRTGTVADAVSAGFSELQALAEECREIVDNASEGLQQTQRVQTFESTADQLESLDEPGISTKFGDLEVAWSEQVNRRAGRGPSRATRCGNAVAALQAVVDLCDTTMEEQSWPDDEGDGVETLRDECQQAIDEAEGCEFPGMYG